MAAKRCSASPRDPRDGEDGNSYASKEVTAKASIRTVFQRKCPEELAQRRSMLAELIRQTNELEERRPWTGHSTSPFLDGRGSPQSARKTADGPLRFWSHFECGNLLSAKLVVNPGRHQGPQLGSVGVGPGATELEYELLVDSDTQSAQGHTQWFYFALRNGQFCGTVHFRIVNLRKKKSLYQQGLQPFVFSRKKQRGWEPFGCQGVSYNKKEKSEGRGDVNTLAWSYRIDRKEDEIYFAAYPPYTYSMMNSFLSSLEQNPFARCHFQRRELCRSIGQLPVPLLVIGEGVNAPGETNTEQPKDVEAKETEIKEAKSAVVIIARQHPGEVVGSWAVQGLLRFLLGTTPAARRLREEFVFHVIPMVNVDGVVHGNSRCTLAGVDPNRVWHDPNPILHPVVFSLKNHMRSLSQGLSPDPVKGIEMFLDLHGHSAKFGCFFYGSNPSAHISNAVFPKLCSLISTDIDFEQCHWRCPKSHRKTARYVVYKQFGVKYAYTIECSLYAPVPLESGAPAGHFSPSRVEFVGCAVGCGLALFADGTQDFRLKACRQCESEEANRAESEIFRATCDTNLLLDISCPNVLAKRPWFHMERLESRDSVLESLLLTYGEVVPDMSQKLKDSDDGGDSDGDDGEDEDRRKEAAGTATAGTGTTGTTRTSPVGGTAAPAPAVPGSSPTSARKMTSKDTQVKRPTRTLVTGDEDESPRHTPPAPPAPPAPGPSNAQITGLEGRRARVSRARSMDRFDPLQCAGPDYSIPLASNLLALESISTLSYSTFDPLWPRGELNQVASQRRDVFKERDLDVHRENNVSFSGGETPQGHLAMLCSPLCVTGVTPAADVVFDSKAFKTTAGTQSRHLSQEKLERSRAATERSERLSERLRPSGLRHPGRRSSPVDDEDNPLMLRPLQSTRRSSGPDPRRPLR